MHRRAFLSDVGMGFAGLALGAMLKRDGVARAEASAAWAPDGRPAPTAGPRSPLKPRA
jgi:hypothetical protein